MTGALRIGCGAGFWGDSTSGAAQLIRSGEIDVLMLDYLAEITMSILARAKEKKPDLGYATDFVDLVIGDLAEDIAARKIKVVANAGGVNPVACAEAVRALLAKKGVALKVATVLGDDVSGELDRLRALGLKDTETGGPLPERVASANAYLGAFPIAAALAKGADIVITGRCVDSALALGPLIAHFGWGPSDFDRLSAGSLAGHVIECGTQATGGIFTDWESVAADWCDMGFPIAICEEDGSFVLTKPKGTGGLVSPMTVAEQIVYEVHDPNRYILPDAVCDWSGVRLEAAGENRVRVSGAKGFAPTTDYKASLTYPQGYRCMATMMIVGRDAVAKAARVGEAILARSERLMGEKGFAPFRETSIEVLGGEANYGAGARTGASREVLLKIAVAHDDKRALEIFAREIFPSATSMAQGITGFAGGRPGVQPIVRLASCLVPKSMVRIEIEVDGAREVFDMPAVSNEAAPVSRASCAFVAPCFDGAMVEVPLIRLAHGRSGDKGDTANIGVLARRAEFLPFIAAALTPEAVAAHFAHFAKGGVERFDWPGLDGFNFVLRKALGGGGVASLRYDPQGKGLAQVLMDFPVPVPGSWCVRGGILEDTKVAA